ncbi:concanavalin A-like lectin/glucanase domain-containing protein [Mycena galopus ATCC 62051]|nr:concanavalin A-like lectin/glucanase domain-containing protein [Mycena galopus ATCC 62051]
MDAHLSILAEPATSLLSSRSYPSVMSRPSLLFLAALLPVALGQLAGTNMPETHPALTWQKCTGTGGTPCTTQSASVVLDANWRWLHQGTNGFTNCYTGNTWNTTACPDGKTCAANCALDGTYGISTSGDALTLKFVTDSQQPNIGSRVYLMAPGSEAQYQTFNFENQEFFVYDLSFRDSGLMRLQLPCGLNGALYFSQMDADGGVAKSNGANKAGPNYGTGYCDSQCPRDIKFINESQTQQDGPRVQMTQTLALEPWEHAAPKWMCGKLTRFAKTNFDGLGLTSTHISAAYTPHPCSILGQSTCTGTACSAPNSTQGTCDQAGCDFNSYRMGDATFYGPGLTVDTSQKFTVVTQFIGSPITEIARFYVQNGIFIPNSNSQVSGVTGNSITDSFCAAQKTAFGDTNTFATKGGLAGMSQASSAGMVLVMSIWDDHAADMLWLDAPYPPNKSPSSPGVTRGTCSASSGAPTDVESASANAQVVFSNIKFGSISSMPGGVASTTSSTPPGNTGSFYMLTITIHTALSRVVVLQR